MNANHKHDKYSTPARYTQNGWIAETTYQPIKSNNGYGCAVVVAMICIVIVVVALGYMGM